MHKGHEYYYSSVITVKFTSLIGTKSLKKGNSNFDSFLKVLMNCRFIYCNFFMWHRFKVGRLIVFEGLSKLNVKIF